MNRISLSRLTDLLQYLRRAPDCFIGLELLEQNNDHGKPNRNEHSDVYLLRRGLRQISVENTLNNSSLNFAYSIS